MSINITTPTEESQEAMTAKTLVVPPAERGGEGGSTVVVTPILTSGTHIADIDVDGETSEIYAPESESGSTVTVTPIVTTGTHIADIDVDGTTNEIYAPASESELPSGGTAGQVLEKYGTGDGEVYWADKRAVPTGGDVDEVLKNLGNGTYGWGAAPTPTIDGTLMNYLHPTTVGNITGADLGTASITAAVANNAKAPFDFGVSYKDLTITADLTFENPYIALINNMISSGLTIQSATRDMFVRIEGNIEVSLTFYDAGDNSIAQGYQVIPITPIYQYVYSSSAANFGLEIDSDTNSRLVAYTGFETTHEIARVSVDSLTIGLNVIEQGGNTTSSDNVTITLPNSSSDTLTLLIGNLTAVKIPFATA